MRLQVKLFIIVAPCGILSLILIYLFTNAGLYERASRDMLNEMNLALNLTGHEFLKFITSAEASVQLLAGTNVLREYASASKQNRGEAILQERVQRDMLQFQQAHPEYLYLKLVHSDRTLDPIATIGESSAFYQTLMGADSPSPAKLPDQFELLTSPTTSIQTDATAGQSVLVITHPVSYEADRVSLDTGASSLQRSDATSNIAHLMLVVDLAGLTDQIEFETISKGAFWSAVTDDGQVVLHANKALIGTVDPQLLQNESVLSTSGEINRARSLRGGAF
ncbi:hypothetical protein [Granulosicoccus antarcticus]|uniref:Uncharacterized protein n=1 Tax=Granulosicoccus antarcticus IMCC3135 TaxID=1192854 RepID=A0A2Z2NV33_9GAMM|nr:hypothetical protein [Granulosicoccus antarcticus]ASJ73578.1 hypothetical protein IMCC3135_17485 [Granulosicoccus antarcticus IMCC3135]